MLVLLCMTAGNFLIEARLHFCWYMYFMEPSGWLTCLREMQIIATWRSLFSHFLINLCLDHLPAVSVQPSVVSEGQSLCSLLWTMISWWPMILLGKCFSHSTQFLESAERRCLASLPSRQSPCHSLSPWKAKEVSSLLIAYPPPQL